MKYSLEKALLFNLDPLSHSGKKYPDFWPKIKKSTDFSLTFGPK